ncbi:MAG: sulfotransferase [Geminicoccaceae bacterium]
MREPISPDHGAHTTFGDGRSSGRRLDQLPAPQFIGIGAQKCATTWLAEMLSGHPDLFMVSGKEVDFFSHHYAKGVAWYQTAHFRDAAGRTGGEISPSYLVDPFAAERAHAFAPDFKIIVALRDPVERAFSNHLHELRKHNYPLDDRTFEAGLAQNPMYLEQSRYGHYLRFWFDRFGSDRIHVVFQEEIPSDPVVAAARVYRFLGVRDDVIPSGIDERTHANVGYRNQGLMRALRLMAKGAKRAGLDRIVKLAKETPGIGTLYRANLRDFRVEVQPMREETREWIASYLSDDMRSLSVMLGGRELPWPSWQMVEGDRPAAVAVARSA